MKTFENINNIIMNIFCSFYEYKSKYFVLLAQQPATLVLLVFSVQNIFKDNKQTAKN